MGILHRLTVVVVKARNLWSETDENENQSNAMRDVQSVFVKVSNVNFNLRKNFNI